MNYLGVQLISGTRHIYFSFISTLACIEKLFILPTYCYTFDSNND